MEFLPTKYEKKIGPRESESFSGSVIMETDEGNVGTLLVTGDVRKTGFLERRKEPTRYVHSCDPVTLHDIPPSNNYKAEANLGRVITVTNTTDDNGSDTRFSVISYRQTGKGEQSIVAGGSFVEVGNNNEKTLIFGSSMFQLTNDEDGTPQIVGKDDVVYEAEPDEDDGRVSIFRIASDASDASGIVVRTRTFGEEKDAQTAVAVHNNSDERIVVSDFDLFGA